MSTSENKLVTFGTVVVNEIVNPFDPLKDIKRTVDLDGRPLKEYINLDADSDAIVSLNGVVVYEWDAIVPCNSTIIISPYVGKGGGSKNILATVAMIALIVVAPYAVGAMMGMAGTAMGMGTAMAVGGLSGAMIMGATAAVMIGGSMLIQSAFKPDVPNLPALGGSGTQESPTYSWGGLQTSQQPNSPIPVLYGTAWVGGTVINKYVTYDGTDEWLNMQIALCHGEIYDVFETDILINNSPFTNYSTQTIDGVDKKTAYLDFRNGSFDQTVMDDFGDTFVLTSNPVLVSKDNPVEQTTVSTNVDRLGVVVNFAQGLRQISNAGANAEISVELGIQYALVGTEDWHDFVAVPDEAKTTGHVWSVGPVFCFVNCSEPTIYTSDSDFFDAYGVEPTEGFMNSIGIVTKITIEDYAESINALKATASTSQAYKKTYRTGLLTAGQYKVKVTRTTNDSTSEQVFDDMYLSYVEEINTEDVNYGGIAMVGIKIKATDNLSGEPNFKFNISRKPINGLKTNNPANAVYDMLTNRQYGAGLTDANIDTNAFDEWRDFCFAQNLPDLILDENDVRETQFIVQESYNDAFSWMRPILVLKGSSIPQGINEADIFSSFAFSIRSVETVGTTGGNIFYAQNIVAVKYVYNVVDDMNDLFIYFPRILTADYITHSFDTFTAEMYPQGYYDDNILKFNGVLDTQSNLWDSMQKVSKVGRGQMVIRGTQYSPVVDKPTPITQLFNDANILDDSFSVAYIGVEDMASEIEIQYADNALNGEMNQVNIIDTVVESGGLAPNKTTMQLIGATTQTQALTHGKYLLAQNKYIKRTMSFKASVDAIACTVGDVIGISNSIPEWGIGGRIEAINSATNLTIDKTIDMPHDIGKTTVIRIRKDDDSIVLLNVGNDGATDSNSVDVISTVGISAGAVYSIGLVSNASSNDDIIQARIIDISRDSEQTRSITAIEYNESILDFNYDNDLLNVVTPQVKQNVAVSNVDAYETLVKLQDGTIVNRLVINWESDAKYQVKYSIKIYRTVTFEFGTATDYIIIKDIESKSYTHDVTFPIDSEGLPIKVVVYPQTSSGLGLETAFFETTLYGNTKPPADVTGYSSSSNDNILSIVWTQNTEVDFKRYNVTLTNTADALEVHVFTPTSSRLDVSGLIAGATYTVEIDAEDTTENKSNPISFESVAVTKIANSNIDGLGDLAVQDNVKLGVNVLDEAGNNTLTDATVLNSNTTWTDVDKTGGSVTDLDYNGDLNANKIDYTNQLENTTYNTVACYINDDDILPYGSPSFTQSRFTSKKVASLSCVASFRFNMSNANADVAFIGISDFSLSEETAYLNSSTLMPDYMMSATVSYNGVFTVSYDFWTGSAWTSIHSSVPLANVYYFTIVYNNGILSVYSNGNEVLSYNIQVPTNGFTLCGTFLPKTTSFKIQDVQFYNTLAVAGGSNVQSDWEATSGDALILNKPTIPTVTSTSVTDGANTFNKYTHPTTSGNKHIPSGGTVGQVLENSADGTVVWSDANSHSHSYLPLAGGTLTGDLTVDNNTPRIDFKSDQSGTNVGGRIELNENGNLWINAQGGKDLWLNWLSPTNPTSKADLRIGDGNGGSSILTVSGASRTVSVAGLLSSNSLISTTNSMQLGAGHNISWGGTYASGSPTIAASTTINMYPSGADGSLVASVHDTGLTVNGTVTAPTFSGSLSGNATTATSADKIDNIDFRNGNSTNGTSPNNITTNGISYVNSISLLGQSDGALYSQAYNNEWVHQIYGDYRTGALAVRGKLGGTWQNWRTVLDEVNSNVINWVTPGKVKASNLGRTLRRDTIDGDTNNWDSQAYSVESYAGDVKFSFRMSEIDSGDANHAMIGLNTDPTTNASYASIDYCWYIDNGGMRIYEGSSSKGTFGTWNTNSVYSIQRVDNTIIYKQDDSIVRRVNGVTTSPLFVDSSFHSNIEVRDITFGSADVSLRLKIDNSDNAYGSGLQMLQDSSNTALFPNTDWWSSLRLLHGNSAGYYTELATCFHNDTIAFRRNVAGTKTAWKYLSFTDHTHSRIYDEGGSGNNLRVSSSNEIELFNSSGTIIDMYLNYNGSAGSVRGPGGATMLHTSNYNSYAPALTGTGASGTWGINVTGNAATATNADTVDGYQASSLYRQTDSDYGTAGAGWITVAKCEISRYHGEVFVSDGDSSDHSFIRIDWMRSYADSNFSVINVGGHANRITGVRTLYETADNTYGWKYLQVYVTTSSVYYVRINRLGSIGSYSVPSSVVPIVENTKTGYAVFGNELTGLNNVSLAAQQGIKAGGTVYAPTFSGALSGTASNADKLDNLDSTEFLRSNVDDSFTALEGVEIEVDRMIVGDVYKFKLSTEQSSGSISITPTTPATGCGLYFTDSNGSVQGEVFGNTGILMLSDETAIGLEVSGGAGHLLYQNTKRISASATGVDVDSNITMAQDKRIIMSPNSTYGCSLSIGGNGYDGTATQSSIAPTNENLHIDSGGNGAIYLNWYGGSTIMFGNGSNSAVARTTPNGLDIYGALTTTSTSLVTNLNADTVDGIHGTSFIRSDADDTISGDLNTTGAISYTQGGGTRIIQPQGGLYETNTSSITGLLRIDLPPTNMSAHTMLSFEVSIYDYAGGSDGESVKLLISGYVSNGWHNVSSTVISGRTDKFYNTRFGWTGSHPCVYIGETNSVWNYPQVSVSNVLLGYGGDTSHGMWADGWGITFTTSYGTVYVTRAAELVASYALNSDKLDNLNSAQFLRSDTSGTLTGNLTVDSIDSSGTVTSAYSSLSNTLTCTNYGAGLVGTYSATRYQNVFSMGSSYKPTLDGTSLSSMYGIAWTHHNIGGQSISGLSHQMLVVENGVTKSALGTGIWTAGNVTAYSDRRVKRDLEVIPDAISKIKRLNGYTYNRTDLDSDDKLEEEEVLNHNKNKRHVGVIAQEVLEVLPEAVTGGPSSRDGSEDAHYSVAYGNMVALLIEGIKEQQETINELNARIEKLEKDK